MNPRRFACPFSRSHSLRSLALRLRLHLLSVMPYAASQKRSLLNATLGERYDGMTTAKKETNARSTNQHNRKQNHLRQRAPQQHHFENKPRRKENE